MKVILTQDIKSLGKKGDIKDVSEGYARNFLFPKKMAAVATEATVKSVMEKKEKERRTSEKNREKMREVADTLKGKEIVLKSKEKNGKLFGSINQKDVAEALKHIGQKIKEENIVLKSPIKKIGEYEIDIKLSSEVSTRIRLKVESL